MTNDQLKEFLARQKRLTGIIQDVSGTIEELDMVHCQHHAPHCLKRKLRDDCFPVGIGGKPVCHLIAVSIPVHSDVSVPHCN